MAMLKNDNLIIESLACRSTGPSTGKGIILFHLPINFIILWYLNKCFLRNGGMTWQCKWVYKKLIHWHCKRKCISHLNLEQNVMIVISLKNRTKCKWQLICHQYNELSIYSITIEYFLLKGLHFLLKYCLVYQLYTWHNTNYFKVVIWWMHSTACSKQVMGNGKSIRSWIMDEEYFECLKILPLFTIHFDLLFYKCYKSLTSKYFMTMELTMICYVQQRRHTPFSNRFQGTE